MQELRDVVCAAILDTQSLVQNMQPYDMLMSEWLREIVESIMNIDKKVENNGERYRCMIDVSNYRCVRQDSTPDQCHERNMNYATDILVDICMNVYRLPSRQPTVSAAKRGKSDLGERVRASETADEMVRAIEDEEALDLVDDAEQVLVHSDRLDDYIIMSFPNMLHTRSCILSEACGQHSRLQSEVGGSFIMRGKRRFVPFMERMQHNVPFFMYHKGRYQCEVRSEHLDRRFRSTSSAIIQLTPRGNGKKFGQGQRITVVIPYQPPLPLHVMVVAMGWTFDMFERSMYQMDTAPDDLRERVGSYMDRIRFAHPTCVTQGAALLHIAAFFKKGGASSNPEKLKRSMVNLLQSELYPHLNYVHQGDHVRTCNLKMRYLSWLCSLLFRLSEGLIPPTDRDSYEHIALDGAAELVGQLSRQLLNDFTKHNGKTIHRVMGPRAKKKRKASQPDSSGEHLDPPYTRVNLRSMFNSTRLTARIMSAVSTGRWSEDRKDVSHAMKTTNAMLTLSQLRRISSSFIGHKQSKQSGPRMIHPSSFGYVCPAECFDPDTPVLMYDGRVLRAEDVSIGDVLVDDGGQPTMVHSLCAGERPMYDVIQGGGMASYRVTDNHVLTLGRAGGTVDIELGRFLALPDEEADSFSGLVLDMHRRIRLTGSIRVVPADFGPFAGWQLDGNGRFLLADGTVVHNTPEGKNCGLVYTMAMTAQLSHDGDHDCLMSLLLLELADLHVPLTSVPLDGQCGDGWWKMIGPRGVFSGWLTDVDEALRRVRRLRRQRAIEHTVSVYTVSHHRALYVKSSAGRLVRPLLVLENVCRLPELLDRCRGADSRHVVDMVLSEGVVEYLDAAESCSNAHSVCVALGPSSVMPYHTHMEISDVAFVGICASLMPYFRHNQGPRLVYEIGMYKQYISPMALDDHGANVTHTLNHGQRPLVTTRHEREDACEGLNLVVALCMHPRAQEDAVAFKRSAVERGAFSSNTTKTHSATHTRRSLNQGQDRFERPPATTFGRKFGVDYDNVQDNGMPRRGTVIRPGGVIIGRTIPHNHVNSSSKVKVPAEFRDKAYGAYRRDASVYARNDEGGVVSDVLEAPGIRKVRVTEHRFLTKGDKISNRYGQKATIGIVEDDVDMPFSEATGIIPDVIVGPTAIPSRMTMGMLLEMLVGKAVTLTGDRELGVDRQTMEQGVTEENIAKVGEVLRKRGYSSNGRERMRDGKTGELLETEIFVGPIFYGKMDHMVARKVHARSSGARQPITRQPTEGRRNNGGFRLGTMEIDVLTAHGVSAIMRERSVKVSDEVKVYRCANCGFAGDANPDIGLFVCRYCKSSKDMRTVRQSHTTNVMFEELACNGISARMELKDVE